jgi:hypothetical protein
MDNLGSYKGNAVRALPLGRCRSPDVPTTSLRNVRCARGLLHIGKDHGGQFLMSPGEQFRMSLDRTLVSSLSSYSSVKNPQAVEWRG